MKTEFKQTSIGKIPVEWKVVTVGELFQIETGTTPSTKNKSYWNGKIVWITPDDLSDLGNRSGISDSKRKITGKAIKETNLSLVEPKSIVLSTRAPVGYVAVGRTKFTFNQGCKALVPKSGNRVVSEFYYYYLIYSRKNLEYMSGRTTFQELTKPLLKKLKLPLPPLPEQEKIAEVLSTVDEAIQKVDEAIEKTERLKKGLMQKLLTEGIDHEEFKETPIGRIPKEWSVVELGDKKITEVTMGSSPPSSTYNTRGKGMPFLQGSAEFGEIHPTHNKYCSKPQRVAQKNDILLSVRAPVGDINIAQSEYCIGRGLSAIRAKENSLENLFLFYYLKFSSERFEKLSLGSTFKAIRKDEIRNFKIPLPPVSEQKEVAEILSTVDGKLELERRRRAKFERIKRGLMNDLLTGRKRAKV